MAALASGGVRGIAEIFQLNGKLESHGPFVDRDHPDAMQQARRIGDIAIDAGVDREFFGREGTGDGEAPDLVVEHRIDLEWAHEHLGSNGERDELVDLAEADPTDRFLDRVAAGPVAEIRAIAHLQHAGGEAGIEPD